MTVIDRAHRLVLILFATAIPAVYIVDSIAEVAQGEFRMSRGMEVYVGLMAVAGYQIAKKHWQADWIIIAAGTATAVMGFLRYSGTHTVMDVTAAAILVPILGLAAIVIGRRGRVLVSGTFGVAAMALTALALLESGLRVDDVVTKTVAVAFSFLMCGWLLHRLRAAYEEQYSARERFVASVSHELRGPLTALAGFAELLSDDGQDAETVALIRSQSWEAVGIVEDLLTTARVDSGEVTVSLEATDLSREIDAVLDVQTTDKHLSSTALPVRVDADPLRLRQIVRNLVTNALRHGGNNIIVRSFAEEGIGYVEVADDGDGFDDADAETIFAPYGRARETDLSTGSIGLGLTVSRQLARLMSGDLAVVREDGWTKFRLSLPTSAEDAKHLVTTPHP